MRIGLVGGLSPVSTIEYYRIYNRLVGERLKPGHSGELTIATVDFGIMTEWAPQGRWDLITAQLLEKARYLEAAGAEVLLLASNTVHRTVPELVKGLRVPVLHIADCLGTKLRSMGLKKVGLLGTKDLMNCGHYQGILQERYELEVLTPAANQHGQINRIIFSEFCRDIKIPASVAFLYEECRNMVENGAGAIILGCTELEIFLDSTMIPCSVLNSMEEHVRVAVALWFNEDVSVPLTMGQP